MENIFNEARLLDEVAYGSQFGREFNTRVVRLRSGVERRNAEWSRPLGKYSLMFQLIEPEDQQYIVEAHAACMGSLVGFRFKDWSDYEAVDEAIGKGTGQSTEYQLTKTYTFGTVSHGRKISKPVQDKVTIFVDGNSTTPENIDYTTGIVTLNAPVDSVITWSGEFDVPVRFTQDRLDTEPVVFTDGDGGKGHLLNVDVELTEVRL